MNQDSELRKQLALRQTEVSNREVGGVTPLIDPVDVDEFLRNAAPSATAELDDILARAIKFTLPSANHSLEVSFLSLSAALESILTFFRRQGDYEILAADEFSQLESDFKRWVKQQPALAHEPAKRALIYEKLRELNRFPFSHVFKSFCEHYSLDLTDLWPVTGKHAEWPLTEIRHRLVHGDPFLNRPVEALACARAHLSWAVERMLLSVLDWPIERSNVAPDSLRGSSYYGSWKEERARFRESV